MTEVNFKVGPRPRPSLQAIIQLLDTLYASAEKWVEHFACEELVTEAGILAMLDGLKGCSLFDAMQQPVRSCVPAAGEDEQDLGTHESSPENKELKTWRIIATKIEVVSAPQELCDLFERAAHVACGWMSRDEFYPPTRTEGDVTDKLYMDWLHMCLKVVNITVMTWFWEYMPDAADPPWLEIQGKHYIAGKLGNREIGAFPDYAYVLVRPGIAAVINVLLAEGKNVGTVNLAELDALTTKNAGMNGICLNDDRLGDSNIVHQLAQVLKYAVIAKTCEEHVLADSAHNAGIHCKEDGGSNGEAMLLEFENMQVDGLKTAGWSLVFQLLRGLYNLRDPATGEHLWLLHRDPEGDKAREEARAAAHAAANPPTREMPARERRPIGPIPGASPTPDPAAGDE